ncbi:hypothetical protein [Parasitella parasitica]|uniref:Uncharacterized protein n=1 Tax=Parasitella parasitica TaxID=35722 RepID=A0A0B7MPJ9_9FUNG|nr:hypothetical protein [Parasitella parasitica]
MELTKLEYRWVAPRNVFQRIWTLRGTHGQYQSKRGTVIVPISVDTTVQFIPRCLDGTNILPVVLNRRMRYIGGMPNERVPQRAEGEDAQDENQVEEEEQQPGLDHDDELNTGSTETSIASEEALRMAQDEGKAPISILVDRARDILALPETFMGKNWALQTPKPTRLLANPWLAALITEPFLALITCSLWILTLRPLCRKIGHKALLKLKVEIRKLPLPTDECKYECLSNYENSFLPCNFRIEEECMARG